jgi:hypothetical protein
MLESGKSFICKMELTLKHFSKFNADSNLVRGLYFQNNELTLAANKGRLVKAQLLDNKDIFVKSFVFGGTGTRDYPIYLRALNSFNNISYDLIFLKIDQTLISEEEYALQILSEKLIDYFGFTLNDLPNGTVFHYASLEYKIFCTRVKHEWRDGNFVRHNELIEIGEEG